MLWCFIVPPTASSALMRLLQRSLCRRSATGRGCCRTLPAAELCLQQTSAGGGKNTDFSTCIKPVKYHTGIVPVSYPPPSRPVLVLVRSSDTITRTGHSCSTRQRGRFRRTSWWSLLPEPHTGAAAPQTGRDASDPPGWSPGGLSGFPSRSTPHRLGRSV